LETEPYEGPNQWWLLRKLHVPAISNYCLRAEQKAVYMPLRMGAVDVNVWIHGLCSSFSQSVNSCLPKEQILEHQTDAMLTSEL
jgi:hypothetical protein